MCTDAIQKFELFDIFKIKYGAQLHPELDAIKFCQNGRDFYIELYFTHSPEPVNVDITLISFEFDEEGDMNNVEYFFEPGDDFVDNAQKLIHRFDTYTLNNLIPKLFEDKVSAEIKKYLPPDYLLQELEDQED